MLKVVTDWDVEEAREEARKMAEAHRIMHRAAIIRAFREKTHRRPTRMRLLYWLKTGRLPPEGK